MPNDKPLSMLKGYLATPLVMNDFAVMLGEQTPGFFTSIINLVSQDERLQECSAESILAAAKRAAALGLPLDKSLGFCYILAYNKEAQFQMGYKGFIQLAIRSGKYKRLMATEIYKDEFSSWDAIKEVFESTPQANHKQRLSLDERYVVGFYGRFELHNGFIKEKYITLDAAFDHAKMYSKSYQSDLHYKTSKSLWQTNPTPMGIKTVLIKILGTYGLMSVEMQEAFVTDNQSFDSVLNDNTAKVNEEAGSVICDGGKSQPEPENAEPPEEKDDWS